MDPVWSHLRKWLQYKKTLLNSGVRQNQGFPVQDLVLTRQKIQINGSTAVGLCGLIVLIFIGAFTTQFLLDQKQG